MASARSPANGEGRRAQGRRDIVDRPFALFGRARPALTAESIRPRSVSDSRSCWRAIWPTIDFEHREAFDLVVLAVLVAGQRLDIDHVEGIEREARGQLELDKGPAEGFGHMFERAAVIDDDDLGPCPRHRRANVLQEDRLARTRLAEDRDIVIAGRVLERRPEEGLAAPPDEQHMRDVPAHMLALKRRDRGGGGRQHGLEALHPPAGRADSPLGNESGIAASNPMTCR